MTKTIRYNNVNGRIIKLTIVMSIRMKTIITTMWINIIIIIKEKQIH